MGGPEDDDPPAAPASPTPSEAEPPHEMELNLASKLTLASERDEQDPAVTTPEPSAIYGPVQPDETEAAPEPNQFTPPPQPHIVRRPGPRVWRRVLLVLAALLFLGPPALTLVYRVAPPPITILMVERLVEGEGLHKSWRPLADISPALANAVIAGEDARFCEHHGFDFSAMRAAAAHNERRLGKVRGGSTISQQTAKNVFLWPARDYLRKGLEAGFTVLEEALWGKRRILEVYLNVVEWGPGTYGAEAAAERYFNEDAMDLTPAQAARLAAILPNPLKWRAVNPGRYVQRRSRRIGAGERTVREDGLAACLR